MYVKNGSTIPPLFIWFLFLGGLFQLYACKSKESLENTTYQVIVIEQGSGELSAFDSANGRLLGSVKIGYNPHEIAITQDGKTAYVSNFGIEDYDHTIGIPGTSISVVDLSVMSVKDSFLTNRNQLATDDTLQALPNKAPHGVRLRPPSEAELFVNVEVGDSMLVYDVVSGQIIRSFPLPPGAHNFIFSPKGDTIWLFAGANGVYRLNPDTGKVTWRFETTSVARGIIFTNDYKQLIVSCENEIYLLNVSDRSVAQHYQDLDVKQIIYSCQTTDGQYILAPCPYDGLVLVIDFESGKVVKRLTTGKAPIYVQMAPDARHAYIANALDDHLSVIDLQNFSVRDFGEATKPNGFAFVQK